MEFAAAASFFLGFTEVFATVFSLTVLGAAALVLALAAFGFAVFFVFVAIATS
jgi:hypothetical protein